MPLYSPDIPQINQQAIQSSLSTNWLGKTSVILNEVSSTNSHALSLADAQAVHGTVIVAERQTAGRGRFNRDWFSPGGANLYASILLVPPQGFTDLPWIPLIAGLALLEAIEKSCGLTPTLKWPNDVLMDGKKLGGILCEGTSKGGHSHRIVVGMGLNVHMAEHDFPADLRDRSTSLRIHTQDPIDRNLILGNLLNALETWYTSLLAGPIDSIRSAYESHCDSLGRQLQVHFVDGETFVGIGQSIGQDGAIHILPDHPSSSPVRVIYSADVTHISISPG